MAENVTPAQAEDVMSVGSRISWAAIFAGAVLALAMNFLLMMLGGAVGLSVRDRVDPDKFNDAAVIWTILCLCISLFVGGVVTSQFTVGENKMEAVIYGIIMWALLVG